jgi:hypothetical protein
VETFALPAPEPTPELPTPPPAAPQEALGIVPAAPELPFEAMLPTQAENSGAAPSYAALAAERQAGQWTQPSAEMLSSYPYTAEDGAIPAHRSEAAQPAAAQPGLLPVVAYADPAEIRETDTGFAELSTQQYSSLEDFLAKNEGRGSLTVQVLTTERDAPIPGCKVRVTRSIGGTDYLFYDALTDASGRAERMLLPAPKKQYTFQPVNGEAPYALYDIAVIHFNGSSQVFRNATIFDDTESIQVVHFSSSPASASYDGALYTE